MTVEYRSWKQQGSTIVDAGSIQVETKLWVCTMALLTVEQSLQRIALEQQSETFAT